MNANGIKGNETIEDIVMQNESKSDNYVVYVLVRLMKYLYLKGNVKVPFSEWESKYKSFIKTEFGTMQQIIALIKAEGDGHANSEC